MTTDVRIFTASTMQEALDLVRRDLGSDAIILHTRQIEKRKLLPWPRTIQEVEITAGVGVNLRQVVKDRTETPARSAVTTPRNPAVQGRLAHPVKPALSQAAEPKQEAPKPADAVSELAPPPSLLQPRQTIAARVAAQKLQAALPSGKATMANKDILVETDTAKQEPSSVSVKPIVNLPQAMPPRPPVVMTSLPAASRLPVDTAQSQVFAARIPLSDDPAIAIQQRLDLLQKMISDLGKKPRNEFFNDVPPELFHLYTQLVEAEVDDDLARELLLRLKQVGTPAQLADSRAAVALLTTLVEQRMTTTPPVRMERGRQKVIAIVGPTGVGKTTTLAKLAANFRLQDGLRVGLVTVDTYRIAAVEQLRTYADIIDLPMKVVTSPGEMRQALEELAGLDLVLIDTAGRSPRDEVKIQELKLLLAEARPDETYLVLSLSAGAKAIESAATQFRPAGPTALILSKLDEAVGCGPLVSISAKSGLPISYLTTGQDVPEDIEPANASRMAQFVLGLESIQRPLSEMAMASH